MENTRMNPEVKTKWLEALRSDNYNKGVMSLKISRADKVFHCCLGVLCEIYIQETGKGSWQKTYESSFRLTFTSENESSGAFPTKDVLQWAGIQLEGSRCISFQPDEQDRQKYGDNTSLVGNNDSSDFADDPSYERAIEIIEKYF